MNSASLTKPVDLQGLSLALAKMKADYLNQIDMAADMSLGIYKVNFSTSYNAVADVDVYESNVSWWDLFNRESDGLGNIPIVFYLDGQFFGFANIDYTDEEYPSFYAEQFSKGYSDYSDDGLVITKKGVLTINHNDEITFEIIEYPYDHAPEDDVEVLNLLSQYNYTIPVMDSDGDLIEDADGNILLG